jgi:hypothetical protein
MGCTFALVYLDLHFGIVPEETAYLCLGTVGFLFVDFHEDVFEVGVGISFQFLDFELSALEEHACGGFDGRELRDFGEGEL